MKIRPYLQPAFLICVAVLAVAAGGMSMATSYLGLQLIKLPLPLKKSLDLINETGLSPYKVASKQEIRNKDVLENLGTKDYIQWALEDTQADPFSPVRYCSLFITYYTGNPDQVPHVPEECYFGSGYKYFTIHDLGFKLTSSDENLSETGPQDKHPSGVQRINTLTAGKKNSEIIKTVPGRCLVFSTGSDDIGQTEVSIPVFYLFHVNGMYAGNRNMTRAIMGKNLFGKYSYFSKVEWKFYGKSPNEATYPDIDSATKASERLLSALLPILETGHWPDWQEALKNK